MALAEVFWAFSDNENIFSRWLPTSMTSPQSMRKNLLALKVIEDIFFTRTVISWCNHSSYTYNVIANDAMKTVFAQIDSKNSPDRR